jgi:hypothetical protein
MATLAALVTRVREKVDEDTAAFWSDTSINNQINESYRYYWSFIIKTHEGYFNKLQNISFDGNANGEYALPSDYAKTRLVSRILSNEKIPLRYYERWDTAISKTLGNSNMNLPTYRFRANYMVFEPAPDFSETDAIEHEYSPVLTDLDASHDTDSGFPALALDCVVIRAVIKCKGIEEMVAGGGVDRDPFIQDLLTTEQNLKELLEHRTNQRTYVEQFGPEDNDSGQIWTY